MGGESLRVYFVDAARRRGAYFKVSENYYQDFDLRRAAIRQQYVTLVVLLGANQGIGQVGSA